MQRAGFIFACYFPITMAVPPCWVGIRRHSKAVLPDQATRAYLHKEEDVEAALNKAGWKVTNREMTASRFYFSRLLQAEPM